MEALHPHMLAKKHIIWDWNGTLLRDIELSVQTTNRLLAEDGLPPLSLERYKQIFRFPVVEYYGELGFDTSRENFRELCARFNRHFHAGLDAVNLWPGARETLAEMQRQGKLQSVLSASEQSLLESQVARYSVESFFAHIHGIHNQAAASKVARGRELMAKVGLRPEASVLVGDTDHDLEVGEALGVDVILVDHGHQCGVRLRNAHHTVVKIF